MEKYPKLTCKYTKSDF